jgi:hypothetical protein
MIAQLRKLRCEVFHIIMVRRVGDHDLRICRDCQRVAAVGPPRTDAVGLPRTDVEPRHDPTVVKLRSMAYNFRKICECGLRIVVSRLNF